MLGMAQAAAMIRGSASNRLQDHLDLFEMMRKEDEIVLSGYVLFFAMYQSPYME